MIKLRISHLPPTTYQLLTTKNAFTIVEIIIVITIMGILITLGVVNLHSSQANARDAERKVDIETIAQHLETYYTGGTDTTQTNTDCTGGNVTHDNGYTVHKFTTVGDDTLDCTINTTAEVLIVGGGGGGGAGWQGGGGGGGGVMYNSSLSLIAQSYTVIVGDKGAGGLTTSVPESGGNSSFDGQIAYGGGSGGSEQNVWSLTPAAASGGSGGGGSHGTSAPALVGGSGTTDQGNVGGNGYTGNPYVGGGGGGAGYPGGNATSSAAGNGGNGISNNISGTALFYSGGGGGSLRGGGTSTGGSGGGGNGNGSGVGSNATYYGGGGGAAGNGTNGQGGPGGNGYPGIVIVRYPTPIGIGSYPSTIITDNTSDSITNLTSALRDIDTKSVIAPGLSTPNDIPTITNGYITSTFVPALCSAGVCNQTIAGAVYDSGGTTTGITKNQYIYQPLQSDGTLCTTTLQECRKFNLFYKLEVATDDCLVPNNICKVTSINQ